MTTLSEQEKYRPLTLGTKLAYGIGDLGPAMVSMIKGFFLLFFLVKVAGMNAATAGTLLLLAKIWDAINDPIIGTLTDRTNTRWGRRRPWLLFGSIPFALGFIMQFSVPSLSDTGTFLFYLFAAILLDSGFTAVNVPYAALTPELSKSEKDRTTLNTYRFSFSVLGGLVAAVMYGAIVDGVFQNDPIQGNFVQALIIAAVIIVSNVIIFLVIREDPTIEPDPNPLPFVEGLTTALASIPFRYVATIYMLLWIAIQFVQSLLIFFYRDYIVAGLEGKPDFSIVLIGLQFSIFLFIMFWGSLSKRLGRKTVSYIGIPIWILASIGLWFAQPGDTTMVIVLGSIAGIGVAIGFFIPWSLLPDVVDHDELKTGKRREGIFYGYFVFLQKLGISIAIFFQGQVLNAAGYVEQTIGGPVPVQPDSALTAIRFMISFVPLILLVISIFVIRKNPITREKLVEIQAELAARKAA